MRRGPATGSTTPRRARPRGTRTSPSARRDRKRRPCTASRRRRAASAKQSSARQSPPARTYPSRSGPSSQRSERRTPTNSLVFPSRDSSVARPGRCPRRGRHHSPSRCSIPSSATDCTWRRTPSRTSSTMPARIYRGARSSSTRSPRGARGLSTSTRTPGSPETTSCGTTCKRCTPRRACPLPRRRGVCGEQQRCRAVAMT